MSYLRPLFLIPTENLNILEQNKTDNRKMTNRFLHIEKNYQLTFYYKKHIFGNLKIAHRFNFLVRKMLKLSKFISSVTKSLYQYDIKVRLEWTQESAKIEKASMLASSTCLSLGANTCLEKLANKLWLWRTGTHPKTVVKSKYLSLGNYI